MTYKNAKTIFVAVLAIGLLGGSIVATQNVAAQPLTNVGKNTITSDFPSFSNPDIERATEITKKFSVLGISEADKESLNAEHENLIAEWKSSFSQEKRDLATEKRDAITSNIIENMNAENSVNNVPINALYVDDVTGELVIGIDAMAFSTDTAKSVQQYVRSIAGNEIDVKIQPMNAGQTLVCSQTGNCEPAQGGVKIDAGSGGCSVGFKATYNGDDGFITAGHCNGGSSSGTVGQPNYFWWDHIGTVTDNSYDSAFYFDGMFVHADDGETISDKVYNNVNVNTASYATYLDGVILEGYTTSGVSGVVTVTSVNYKVEGNWHLDHALTNAVAKKGDSGGTAYEYVPSLGFVGIISAGDQSSWTIISKQQNAGSEFSGITWDFN